MEELITTSSAFSLPSLLIFYILAQDVDSIADTINSNTDCYFEGTTCPTVEDNEHDYPYNVGDRIAQIMIVPYPKVIFEEVDSKDDLGETERGDGGHGSTGK